MPITFILAVSIVAVLLEYFFPWRKFESKDIRWIHAMVLTTTGLVLISMAFPSGIVATAESVKFQVGILNIIDLPFEIRVVVSFITLDLFYYFTHRSMHHFPILWRFHKVHHSDEGLDASTLFRFHPIEGAIYALVQLFAVLLFGISALEFVIFLMVSLTFGLWSHANVYFPEYLKHLALMVITPNMHRVHHCDDILYSNHNFGNVLSVWDRLFKTYCALDKKEMDFLSIGISKSLPSVTDSKSIVRLLSSPFEKK